MPPTQTDEGLRAAKEIREKHPDTAVLVLSQYVEEGYALELLQESAEGIGYLLKDRVYDLADFVAAVKRVAEGGSALDPSVVSQLVGRRRRDDPIGELTVREREVLELMPEGLSNSGLGSRSASARFCWVLWPTRSAHTTHSSSSRFSRVGRAMCSPQRGQTGGPFGRTLRTVGSPPNVLRRRCATGSA